jgi:hypothetical protein
MNFLKQLLAFLFDSTSNRTDFLGPLDKKEALARYVLSRRHFSSQSGKLKAAAFIPPPNNRLSVFRIAGLLESEIWHLGEREVAQPANRTIHGRGDLRVNDIEVRHLVIEPDDHPRRHADIVGWPSDKAEQKAIAQLLAESAVPRRKP